METETESSQFWLKHIFVFSMPSYEMPVRPILNLAINDTLFSDVFVFCFASMLPVPNANGRPLLSASSPVRCRAFLFAFRNESPHHLYSLSVLIAVCVWESMIVWVWLCAHFCSRSAIRLGRRCDAFRVGEWWRLYFVGVFKRRGRVRGWQTHSHNLTPQPSFGEISLLHFLLGESYLLSTCERSIGWWNRIVPEPAPMMIMTPTSK